MIGKIADKLALKISGLNYVDRITGLAKVISKNIAGEGGMVAKKIPTYLNLNKTTCDNADYIDLVPDSKLKSIIYFEDQGTSKIDCSGRYDDFETNLRLVFWCNLGMIDQGTDLYNIQSEIISTLIGRIDNFDYVVKIIIELADIPEKSPTIFAEFSYSEEDKQYLLYPYDYFALDFSVKWSLAKICYETTTLNPNSCMK